MTPAALVAAVTLFALGIALGILKRQHKLSAHGFAVSMAIYWSLFFMSIVHAGGAALTGRRVLADGIILLVCWTVIYWLARWIYRAIDS